MSTNNMQHCSLSGYKQCYSVDYECVWITCYNVVVNVFAVIYAGVFEYLNLAWCLTAYLLPSTSTVVLKPKAYITNHILILMTMRMTQNILPHRLPRRLHGGLLGLFLHHLHRDLRVHRPPHQHPIQVAQDQVQPRGGALAPQGHTDWAEVINNVMWTRSTSCAGAGPGFERGGFLRKLFPSWKFFYR